MPEKVRSFIIRVESPCQEKWETMMPATGARFCLHCNKEVVDFSVLSDTELRVLLQDGNKIPCGRFKNSQLNRLISNASTQPSVKTGNSLARAAAVLTLLSLQLTAASSVYRNSVALPTHTPVIPCRSAGDTIRITGLVKDQSGLPLAQAEIAFDGKLMGLTDQNGQFTFELSNPGTIRMKSYLLSAGYPGLQTATRSFHPAMGSTSFDLTLYEPAAEQSLHIMGIPYLENRIAPLLLTFRKNEISLKEDTRKALSEISVQMKNEPRIHIDIISSGHKTAAQTEFNIRQAITRYMEESEGISTERFHYLISEDNQQKAYTIRIRQSVNE